MSDSNSFYGAEKNVYIKLISSRKKLIFLNVHMYTVFRVYTFLDLFYKQEQSGNKLMKIEVVIWIHIVKFNDKL